MTVNSVLPPISYAEDGVTTAFPVPFRFDDASHLVVERVLTDGSRSTLTLGVDYSAAGAGLTAGGSITRTAATNGATLVIDRSTTIDQQMHYADGDKFPAASHEGALDKGALVDQDLQAQLERSLKLPSGETMALLPRKDALAGNVLGFDDLGSPTIGPNVNQLFQIIGAIFNPIFTQLASLVMFLATGIGAIVRSVQDKLNERISVIDFGAVAGATANADAFQAAVNAAIARGNSWVYVPPSLLGYKIEKKVTCGRVGFYSDGMSTTAIVPTITNGDPVFDFTAGSNWFGLKGLRIDSGLNQANFLSGAINAQNCTGVKITSNSGSSIFSARYLLRDVLVRGCKVGYNIDGFLGDIKNVWATECETGLIGTRLNNCEIGIRYEQCRKPYAITASNGFSIDMLCDEGGVLASGLQSSTIDGCNGFIIHCAYYEQIRNVPFLTIGATTECRGVEVIGGSTAMGDNAGNDYDNVALALDKINGLILKGYFSTGAHHSTITTTVNTKNIIDLTVGSAAYSSFFAPHDASGNLSRVENIFPNPLFHLWFRGWPNVSVVRATMSKETTLVRRGKNAVRLTLAAGQTNGSITFVFNDSGIGVAMQGRQLTAFAWVWIPNTSDYDPNATTNQIVQPSLNLFYDGTGSATKQTGTHHTKRGAWNLFRTPVANIPTDCTRIDVSMSASRITGTFAGTEYLVIDSIFLVEGDGQDWAVRNGWIADSDLNPCKGIGGKAIIRGNAEPTDTDQIFEAGDWIIKGSAAAAGASPDWVCTTGGAAGSTAVFKADAAVAA